MLKDVEADQDRCGELKQAEALDGGTFRSPAVPAPACSGKHYTQTGFLGSQSPPRPHSAVKRCHL